jgi:hypothetical protein
MTGEYGDLVEGEPGRGSTFHFTARFGRLSRSWHSLAAQLKRHFSLASVTLSCHHGPLGSGNRPPSVAWNKLVSKTEGDSKPTS